MKLFVIILNCYFHLHNTYTASQTKITNCRQFSNSYPMNIINLQHQCNVGNNCLRKGITLHFEKC